MKGGNSFGAPGHGDGRSALIERLASLRLKAASTDESYTIGLRAEKSGMIPLSFGQERLWFLDQMGLVGAAYNRLITLSLSGHPDKKGLEHAFSELLRRHEILRTRFEETDGIPYQVIDPPKPLRVQRVDFSGIADRGARDGELQSFMQLELQHRFSLAKGPLIRVLLVNMGGDEYTLLVTLHHIISDGWSIGVLLREIGALYESYVCHRPVELRALPIQYADFSLWQRRRMKGEVLQWNLSYWTQQLAGAPLQLDLPTDRPRPAMESFRGGVARFQISRDTSHALEEFAKQEGLTLFMVLLTAYQILLARWSGKDDIVVGSPSAGRVSAETEELIGFFVNTIALRTKLEETQTTRQLLKAVRETTLGAFAHQDLPFDRLVEELHPERDLARQPIFQVLLAFQNFPHEELSLSGVTCRSIDTDHLTSKFDMSLYLYQVDGAISGLFEFSADLFNHDTINRMAGHFKRILDSIYLAPDRLIEDIPMLDSEERETMLVDWNRTGLTNRNDGCLHDLFSSQATRTPEAIAAICGKHSLSYYELNARANQLARYLSERGAGPETTVGISVDRGIDMIVSILGVLKSGAAYIPLDPRYPAERIRDIVEDARPCVIICKEHQRGKFSNTASEILSLDSEWGDIRGRSAERCPEYRAQMSPHHLAYVIYTSGSTGRPKGVAIEHRNAVNLLLWAKSETDMEEFRVTLQSTSLNFDLSVYEIFVPLTHGGAIKVVENALALIDDESGLTLINTVPSAISAVLESATVPPSVRVINLAGEALTENIVDQIFAKTAVGTVRNLYGPSETTTYSTAFSMPRDLGFSPSIGRPVANTQIYILDSRRRVVPVGVMGEIYIGGAGVARGYLRRPDITAERFVPDPFSEDGGVRMYRTGDRGRWKTNGTIEYLGRNDHQVKIRGYRIETGEIEARLRQYRKVKDAVVVARGTTRGDTYLVAYLVADETVAVAEQHGAEDKRQEIVGKWETVWKETYGERGDSDAPTFAGWNSSYSGQPIPEWQMLEWLACTLRRLTSLKPKKVLEIGCGVGLILQHLAPLCQEYVALDFSETAIKALQKWIQDRSDLRHVTLLQRAARDLREFAAESFDTVVINSVVQYFPDLQYFLSVLEAASRLVCEGGNIFIGDVRHLGLLPMFCAGVQFRRADPWITTEQLRARINRAISQEEELLIRPEFFGALPGNLPRISSADVRLKRGHSLNELTLYRYDVVLSVGVIQRSELVCQPVDWDAELASLAQLEVALNERRWPAAYVRGIPNYRLSEDALAQLHIEAADPGENVEVIRTKMSKSRSLDIDPEKVTEIAEACGYEVNLVPGGYDGFDMRLIDSRRLDEIPEVAAVCKPVESWAGYSNNPIETDLKQQLIQSAREYVEAALPEYMVPSAWMVLSEIPHTPNGKVDRKALPVSEIGLVPTQHYERPQGKVEETLARIWQEILQIDRVGRHSNFFEVGGHSMLALRVLAKINQQLGVAFKVVDLYQSPTVKQLGERLRGERAVDSRLDLVREAFLDQDIAAMARRGRHSMKSVLITGGTGFVGRFLLAELLRCTDARVFCLVRGTSAEQALSRIRDALLKWDLWSEQFEPRIIPLPGDLKLPKLGLDEELYRTACQSVDTIYHCAASMNHLETYAMARGANVDGLKEILRVATLDVPKLVNYVSTLGVFNISGSPESEAVDEDTPIDNERHTSLRGYTSSKWVAEKLITLARARGVTCNVFRLGLVWADTQKGRYDESQWGYKIIKACLLSGLGIEQFQYDMGPVPVDYVASAIVTLARSHCEGGGVFHIASEDPGVGGIFEKCNELEDTRLKLLPFDRWMYEMSRIHQDSELLEEMPLIEFAYSGQGSHGGGRQFSSVRTIQELRDAGIRLPVLNDAMVRLCIQSMHSRDKQVRAEMDARRVGHRASDRVA